MPYIGGLTVVVSWDAERLPGDALATCPEFVGCRFGTGHKGRHSYEPPPADPVPVHELYSPADAQNEAARPGPETGQCGEVVSLIGADGREWARCAACVGEPGHVGRGLGHVIPFEPPRRPSDGLRLPAPGLVPTEGREAARGPLDAGECPTCEGRGLIREKVRHTHPEVLAIRGENRASAADGSVYIAGTPDNVKRRGWQYIDRRCQGCRGWGTILRLANTYPEPPGLTPAQGATISGGENVPGTDRPRRTWYEDVEPEVSCLITSGDMASVFVREDGRLYCVGDTLILRDAEGDAPPIERRIVFVTERSVALRHGFALLHLTDPAEDRTRHAPETHVGSVDLPVSPGGRLFVALHDERDGSPATVALDVVPHPGTPLPGGADGRVSLLRIGPGVPAWPPME